MIFTAYRRYSDGFLPTGGGSLEQPYKLMEMIDIVIEERQQSDSKGVSRGN